MVELGEKIPAEVQDLRRDALWGCIPPVNTADRRGLYCSRNGIVSWLPISSPIPLGEDVDHCLILEVLEDSVVLLILSLGAWVRCFVLYTTIPLRPTANTARLARDLQGVEQRGMP